MTDKTEEQIASEKAAARSLTAARANMGMALDRIRTLESTLQDAQRAMSKFKGWIPDGVKPTYAADNSKTCWDLVDDSIASIAKVLG